METVTVSFETYSIGSGVALWCMMFAGIAFILISIIMGRDEHGNMGTAAKAFTVLGVIITLGGITGSAVCLADESPAYSDAAARICEAYGIEGQQNTVTAMLKNKEGRNIDNALVSARDDEGTATLQKKDLMFDIDVVDDGSDTPFRTNKKAYVTVYEKVSPTEWVAMEPTDSAPPEQ